MFVRLIASETFELTAAGTFDGSPCSFESPPTSRRQASHVDSKMAVGRAPP